MFRCCKGRVILYEQQCYHNTHNMHGKPMRQKSICYIWFCLLAISIMYILLTVKLFIADKLFMNTWIKFTIIYTCLFVFYTADVPTNIPFLWLCWLNHYLSLSRKLNQDHFTKINLSKYKIAGVCITLQYGVFRTRVKWDKPGVNIPRISPKYYK